MKTKTSWILDTSVAVPWFLGDQPLREKAIAVRADIANNPSSYAIPALFYSELVHVLARERKEEAWVRSSLEIVLNFGLRIVPIELALGRLPALAAKGLGGYDATFVALAEETDAKWLTADDKAARRAGSSAARLATFVP